MSDPILGLIVGVFILGVVALVGLTRRATIVPMTMAASLESVIQQVKEQKDGLEKTQHDVNNMRHVIQHLPTNQSINDLKVAVAGSRGEIAGIQQTLVRNSTSLDRIEDFLMRAGSEAIATGKAKDQA